MFLSRKIRFTTISGRFHSSGRLINIQTKICVGMVLLLLLVSPLGEYIQILLENMLEGAAMALYYFK